MTLDKTLQDSLLTYCKAQIDEQRLQRMAVARQVGLLRAYLKGEPTDWFDSSTWRYRSFEQSLDFNSDNVPRYRHHINITSAAWQILQAAIQTAGIPGVQFEPQNPKNAKDVETARIGKLISDYQHKAINFRALWMGVYRYFFTDGLCIAYEHHVRDSGRYGTTQTQIQKRNEIPVAPGFGCPSCGQFHAPENVTPDEQGNPNCPNCGKAMSHEHYQEGGTRVEITTEMSTIAAGREVVDLFGALETVLPWWAPSREKMPYASIRVEIPPESVFQTFPDMEAKIAGSTDGTDDFRLRIARQQSMSPKDSPVYPLFTFPTYGRWWLRPECFYRDKDPKVRATLLEMFPEGVFLQEVNMEFCDAIPEKLEDHVELLKAFESEGMYCQSIGQNGVPIQESVNTAWNQQLEADEFAAFPPVLIDAEILNGIGLKETKAKAGVYKEIVLPPGKSLRDAVYQIVVKENSQAGNAILESFQMFMDYLVGVSPALLGSSITNTRSADQYNTQRSQALQRQSPPYESAKNGMARVDEMLVNDFLANRTPEEFMEIVGATSMTMQEEAQRLANSRGRVSARAIESESIPQTWSQKDAAIDAMLNNQNPLIQASCADPNNLRAIAEFKALPEWHIPGLEQAEKAQRLIPLLLASPAPPGQTDPQTGQPGPPQQSSIPFDSVFDDPKIQLTVMQEWAASEEGIQAAQQNPNFENLRLYAQACQQALQPQPAQPETPEQMAAEAQKALVAGLNSQDVDKAGALGEKTLEGLSILKKQTNSDAA